MISDQLYIHANLLEATVHMFVHDVSYVIAKDNYIADGISLKAPQTNHTLSNQWVTNHTISNQWVTEMLLRVAGSHLVVVPIAHRLFVTRGYLHGARDAVDRIRWVDTEAQPKLDSTRKGL